MFPMKKMLPRTLSFFVTLSLVLGLLPRPAAAIDYPGVAPITLEATASLLIDLDNDQVLHEVNADEIRYPASITKIMTALLTLEAVGRGDLSLDTMVTADAAALADITADSSTANIAAGETMSVQDLLCCLLIASANESANILAMAVAGDIPTFVEMMNKRAKQLGMDNTHFVNPHGLHHADHYSTARDIYKMAKEAMTHAPFREIVSTSQHTTAATNMAGPRTLYNTNGLLTRFKYYGYTYSGTIGIKTGSTGEAGYCLVAAAKRSGTTLVSVVLGCENIENTDGTIQRKQFTESRRLLDWGFTNFTTATLLDADTYLEEVPVRFSAKASHVVLKPTHSVQSLVPGAYDPEKLDLRLTLNHDTAAAPIAEGDVLGKVAVIYDGEQYDEVEMAAVSDIAFSPFLSFVDSVNAVLGNLFVRILLALALGFFIVGAFRRWKAQQTEDKKAQRALRQQEKKQKAEARHLREQQEYDQRRAEQDRRKKEQAQRREQEQALRRQEQERRRQEEERRRQEEQRRKQEEDRRRREEARFQREQERRRQDEQRRREQERRRQEANRRRWEEEERRWREQRSYDRGRRDDYYDHYRPTSRDDRRGSTPPDHRRDRRPNNRR